MGSLMLTHTQVPNGSPEIAFLPEPGGAARKPQEMVDSCHSLLKSHGRDSLQNGDRPTMEPRLQANADFQQELKDEAVTTASSHRVGKLHGKPRAQTHSTPSAQK